MSVGVCGAAYNSGVGVRGRGGGARKIYLLLSENFDPRVVNLSKESSQLNRKHEEERKRGEAGMFGVFFRSEDRGWVVTILVSLPPA